jgi:pleckstrin homology domain-containing family G member 1/2/3
LLVLERPTDKHTWKWPNSHSSSTPEYLERRHQYRRSEVRYRSKKAKKIADKSSSLERGRIKERRESFISYSREDLFEKERLKKCDHQNNCGCEKIKQELASALKTNRSKSETRSAENIADNLEVLRRNSEDQPPLSPLEIKQYNSKTLPKRIEKIKQKRAKKETAKFYTALDDDAPDDTILKIVEASDDHKLEPSEVFEESQADTSGLNFTKKKDAEIIRSILEKSEFKKIQKPGALRRKSLEQMDKSPLTSRKISEVLAEKATRKESTSSIDSPIIEPLYEELLRNVHVPYKFAPAIVKRSLSVSSSSSTKETIEATPAHAESTTTLNDDDNEGSECDYVTLTYSNEGLETIDGDYVGKNSPPRLNEISNSDTNICYNQRNSLSQLNSTDDLKVTDSIIDLDRRSISSRSRSFLHKFITLRSVDDDLASQRSVAASISASSRKSLDGGFIFNLKNTPPVYRQGSEDMGNRIAHVDYADPKTLFPSAVNIFVNKNSLNQRDSVVSSSSDSVSDLNKMPKQTQPDVEPFSDSFYEDHAESLLENDFRDSAIYSDDSNERRLESNSQSEEHIYATVSKQPTPAKPTPPKIPKKPTLTPLKSNIATRIPTSLQSPPPVPLKPSNLKSPEVRNAIFNVRKLNKSLEERSMLPRAPQSSWVTQQVQKFQ